MSQRKAYLAILMASASFAAVPTLALGAEQNAAAAEIETITVTGSRLRVNGYEAPTPVTVAPVEDLIKSTPTNLIAGIQELPQFLNSANANSGGKQGIGNGRGDFLNLRNLGSNRTLTLLDNVRLPPTTFNGNVNQDIIPQLLVQRVEVVTAGASAAYGSDAVAGVVNYLLDHNFVGVKGQATFGLSTYGDAFNERVGAAGGFDIGDRGHILVSVEHFSQDEIALGDRPNGQVAYIVAGKTPGAGAPGLAANPYVIYGNATTTGISEGGHVLTGPLANTYFFAPSQYRNFNFGTPTGTSGYAVGGDGLQQQTYQSITDTVIANQAMARASYDVSDDVNAHVTALYSKQHVSIKAGFDYFDYNQTIYSGNAYLPVALQTILTTTKTASFALQKYVSDVPLSPAYDSTDHLTVIAGLNGKFGGGFTWDLNYAHGHTDQFGEEIDTPEERKLYAAADAVRDPSGNIVCRVTLTNPGLYPGCVPFNMLGIGAASQAAIDYVKGTSRYDTETTLDQISGSVQGDIFSLWAGPISAAVGGEWRRHKMIVTSNSDPSVVRPVDGLRGILVTAPRFWLSNRGTANRAVNVKEAFGEINVPLARGAQFFQELAINGAVRVTDYSTSGTVTTWKGGGNWRPVDDINFRITRSRDIRAPTIFDLGASGTSGRSTLDDPHTLRQLPVITTGSGNPNLKPEIGDTLTFGGVLTPSFLPGFSISVDYYKINLANAIATLSAQNIVNQCEFSKGADPICNQITRPLPYSDTSAANFPTEIRNQPSNSSFIRTRGLDIEASYQTPVGDGNLTTRLLLTYIAKYSTQVSVALPIVELAGTGGGSSTIPHLKGTLSATYTQDSWSVYLGERMIGKVTMGQAPLNIWAVPPIPAYFYTDLTGTYKFQQWGGNFEVFLSVKNLLNTIPPLIPNTAAVRFQYPTISGYDIIGRTFTLGTRVKF